jgi:histidine triad (HIT) family protein
MSEPDCVFCRIARGELPAQVVNEDGDFVAFRDIGPKAPVHLLVIPRRHLDSFAGVEGMSAEERAAMLGFIARTARMEGLEESGYRVTTNHGPHGRQSVHHLHWHVLGGAPLSESM